MKRNFSRPNFELVSLGGFLQGKPTAKIELKTNSNEKNAPIFVTVIRLQNCNEKLEIAHFHQQINVKFTSLFTKQYGST